MTASLIWATNEISIRGHGWVETFNDKPLCREGYRRWSSVNDWLQEPMVSDWSRAWCRTPKSAIVTKADKVSLTLNETRGNSDGRPQNRHWRDFDQGSTHGNYAWWLCPLTISFWWRHPRFASRSAISCEQTKRRAMKLASQSVLPFAKSTICQTKSTSWPSCAKYSLTHVTFNKAKDVSKEKKPIRRLRWSGNVTYASLGSSGPGNISLNKASGLFVHRVICQVHGEFAHVAMTWVCERDSRETRQALYKVWAKFHEMVGWKKLTCLRGSFVTVKNVDSKWVAGGDEYVNTHVEFVIVN
jgi:hypothetical protein